MGLFDTIRGFFGLSEEIELLRELAIPDLRSSLFFPFSESRRFDPGVPNLELVEVGENQGSMIVQRRYQPSNSGIDQFISVTPPNLRGMLVRLHGQDGRRSSRVAGLINRVASRESNSQVVRAFSASFTKAHLGVGQVYQAYQDAALNVFGNGGVLMVMGDAAPLLGRYEPGQSIRTSLPFLTDALNEGRTFSLGSSDDLRKALFGSDSYSFRKKPGEAFSLEIGVPLTMYQSAHHLHVVNEAVDPMNALRGAEIDLKKALGDVDNIETKLADALKQVPKNLRGPEARGLFIKGLTGSLGLLLALGLFVHSSSAKASENTDVDSSNPENFLENSWFCFGVGLFSPKLDMALSCMEMIS